MASFQFRYRLPLDRIEKSVVVFLQRLLGTVALNFKTGFGNFDVAGNRFAVTADISTSKLSQILRCLSFASSHWGFGQVPFSCSFFPVEKWSPPFRPTVLVVTLHRSQSEVDGFQVSPFRKICLAFFAWE